MQQDPAGGAASRRSDIDFVDLAARIAVWANELGFDRTGITSTDLGEHETHLLNWLDRGYHGELDYMARHGVRRSRPAELLPGTLRIISVRKDYYPPDSANAESVLADTSLGYVSRYALGRDYHKVIRKRLQKLADRIEDVVGAFGYRAFVDSAPVLEKALAEQAGLGWIGKHSNLLSRDAGSWFFLGELYTDLPLPSSEVRETNHCGRCEACIDACPTGAIVAPYQVDARRCISYLTIELHGAIPVALRSAVGNRVFGCDDCQLVCPWNRFSASTGELDFRVRHGLDSTTLAELFGWSEPEYLQHTEGSAIRRIGYERWLRNVAVALGNAPTSEAVVQALQTRSQHASSLVREHVEWALRQHAD